MRPLSVVPGWIDGAALHRVVFAVIVGCVAIGGGSAEAQFGMGGIGIGVGAGGPGGFRGGGPWMGMGSVGPGPSVAVGNPGFGRSQRPAYRGGRQVRSGGEYSPLGTRVRRGPRRW
jgi:hypothetical protein